MTNGKWKVRVKIDNPEKEIPSYIIRKEEGELWSLQYDGRRFVCWKCGSPDHIGDKCKDQERTFEEVFGEDTEPALVSWAAIVRGNTGEGPDLTAKRDAIAKQIRENNEKKARERREAEERRQAEVLEQERVRVEAENERQRTIVAAQEQGQDLANNTGQEGIDDNDSEHGMDLSNPEENLLLVGAVENPAVEGLTLPTLLPKGDGSVQGVNGVQSDDDGQEDNQQGTLLPRGGVTLCRELVEYRVGMVVREVSSKVLCCQGRVTLCRELVEYRVGMVVREVSSKVH